MLFHGVKTREALSEKVGENFQALYFFSGVVLLRLGLDFDPTCMFERLH